MIAGQDINITGKNVNIESSENVYNAHEEHEYKRSGLTVSVGGTYVDAAQSVISPIERANQVEDNRLSALYGVKAGQEVARGIDDIEKGINNIDKLEGKLDILENKTIAFGDKAVEKVAKDTANTKEQLGNAKDNMLNINIGFGSQHSESESDSTTIVSQGSNIKAEGDVTITSNEEDINIKGSNVEGENVTLDAAKDLNVTASKNSNVTEQDSESSSANIGVSVGTGGLLGVNAGYSKGEEDIDANSENYNESTVTADKELDFTSGKDTNIVGGKLSGEKVTGNVGGDLNIESKQDSNSYNEESKSGSLGLEYDFGTHKVGITGGYSEGNIDSDYASVTDQSGIYAGDEGFDIYVEDNTDLKGGIISGDNSDENKLSTGTLTYEDIKNEAEYEAGSTGVNVNIDNGADYNEKGVTPNIGMPAEDEAESTTKATVSEGEIEIRDKENQKQDLVGLNRDTQNALNKLGEIFDKDSIEERQELAGLFGELAYKAVGDLAEKNGWKDGSAEKNALHAFVGGIMAELGGSDFLAGASGSMVNEMVQEKLAEAFKDDPAMYQWASALIGGVVSEIVSENAQAGASAAVSGTKYNEIQHLRPFKNFVELFKEQGLNITGDDGLKAGQYYAINISLSPNDIKNGIVEVLGKSLGLSQEATKNLKNKIGAAGVLGIIVDAEGNLYDTKGISIGLDLGGTSKDELTNPISGSVTIVKGELVNFNKNKNYISEIEGAGLSGGLNILGINTSGSISMEDGEIKLNFEGGLDSSSFAGKNEVSINYSKVDYVGNIFKDDVLAPEYEYNLELVELYEKNPNEFKNYKFYQTDSGTVVVAKGNKTYDRTFKDWVNNTALKDLRPISYEEAINKLHIDG